MPVGSYLSGGMDSASIAAVAARHVPRLMTFTGGFDLSSVTGLELVFDERADAELVASHFRTEHYEMVMHAGDMAWALPELVWHLEDLRVGMSYPNYYIAGLASKFVKVALGGAGGDELFAGYPWRYELVRELDDAQAFDSAYYDYWCRLVPDGEKQRVLHAGRPRTRGRPLAVRRSSARRCEPAAGLDPLSKALYFEAKTFLHGLLVVEDKVSMAHSLEVRVPFLDNELVALAEKIPSRLKHGEGGGKRLLRDAMAPLLPAEHRREAQAGLQPARPVLVPRPDDGLHPRGAARPPQPRPRLLRAGRTCRRVLHEHLEGRVNHRLLIWSLLSFEWWNRLFMDGDGLTRADVRGPQGRRLREDATRHGRIAELAARAAPRLRNSAVVLLAAATANARSRTGGPRKSSPARARSPDPDGRFLEIVDHDLINVNVQAAPMTASQKHDELMPLLDKIEALSPRFVCEIGTSAGGTLYLLTRAVTRRP